MAPLSYLKISVKALICVIKCLIRWVGYTLFSGYILPVPSKEPLAKVSLSYKMPLGPNVESSIFIVRPMLF